MNATLAVIAKAPEPGRSKTRLSPPLSPADAAAVAEAALRDTLAAVAATSAARHVVVLDGEPGPWLTDQFELLPQRGRELDERLGNAFADLAGPALIIGMDTPQVEPALLCSALARLAVARAVLGPALDGGYWAIGLQQPDRGALLGVPMSTSQTFAAQRRRMRERGIEPALLEPLRDIDTFRDAVEVAVAAPATHFASVFAQTASALEAA
jgi:uncharacterized protein